MSSKLANFFRMFHSCCNDSAIIDVSPQFNRRANTIKHLIQFSPPSTPIRSKTQTKTKNSHHQSYRPPSSAPQLTSHLLSTRHQQKLRPKALTFHIPGDDQTKRTQSLVCSHCKFIYYTTQATVPQKNAHRQGFCSGECLWSNNMDTMDQAGQSQHHYHNHFPSIIQNPAQQEQQPQQQHSTKVRHFNVVQDQTNAMETPIRYASDEESQHLSTLLRSVSNSNSEEKENNRNNNIPCSTKQHSSSTLHTPAPAAAAARPSV